MAGLVLTGLPVVCPDAAPGSSAGGSPPTSWRMLAIVGRRPARRAAGRPGRRADADRRRGAGALRRGAGVARPSARWRTRRRTRRTGSAPTAPSRTSPPTRWRSATCCWSGPGEMVPCDGVVIDGASHVDVSRLTGEPVPVSGRARQPAPERRRSTSRARSRSAPRRSPRESQYARIVELVRTAQASKAPIQRLADRYAVWFTPLTLAVCVVAFLVSHDARAGARGAGRGHARAR